MSAEYDAETGASTHPNETDEQREAREARERAKVGQPGEQPDDAQDQGQAKDKSKHVRREAAE